MHILTFQKNVVLFFFFLLLVISCKEQKPPMVEKSTVVAGIQIAKPAAVGMNADLLAEMEQAIISGTYPNIHSMLISKNGKLIYENYFKGADEIWGDSLGVILHHRDSLHDVRSISKSIVSACIGIAIDQGKIKDIDQKVFDFFPEYADHATDQKANLTLKHLLTMTSGLAWNEDVPYTDPENSEILMTDSPDPMEYVLSRPMESRPGAYWNYNGGTTQLLSAILKKTTEMEIDAFAQKYLFGPMGTEKMEWTYFPNMDMPAAASGLRLRSFDLLKFGMLYANKGKWQGKQILSENWVEDSMKSYVTFGRNRNVGYGYQIWIFDGETIAEKQDHDIPAAVGNGDQRIFWDEVNQLIVVVTAGNYNNWTIKKDSEALLTDFIYPSFLE